MSLIAHLFVKIELVVFIFLIDWSLLFCQINNLEELSGFRNSKWGSTVNEIKASETEYYLQSFSGFGVYALSYTGRYAGLKTRIDYTFKDKKLVEGSYIFNPDGDVKRDFKELEKSLINEYGKPGFKAGTLIDSDSIWIPVTKYGRYKGPELYWKFKNGFIALIASKFENDITITILFSSSKSIKDYNKENETSTENLF